MVSHLILTHPKRGIRPTGNYAATASAIVQFLTNLYCRFDAVHKVQVCTLYSANTIALRGATVVTRKPNYRKENALQPIQFLLQY